MKWEISLPTSRLALPQFFSTSVTARIFLICFVATHVPLLATIAYLASGFTISPLGIFLLILAATLTGTAFCLIAIWRINRPLTDLAQAVKGWRHDRRPFRLILDRKDEIGVLADAVNTMVAEAHEQISTLQKQANNDLLTGLGNRRWLARRMPEEMSRAKRMREPFTAVVFDLDHFKAINDTYGHDIGDAVLTSVGEAVRDCLRPYDLAARVGGEEFFLGLPKTDVDSAAAMAERLRERIESLIVHPLQKGEVTASFGLYQANEDQGLRDIMARADKALYVAKGEGRNRVAVYS